MLDLKQAADKLNLSVVTLRRYIKQGKIEASKIGKSYFIKESDIDELLSESGIKSEADLLVKNTLESQKDALPHYYLKDSFQKARELYLKLGDKKLAERANFDANIFGFTLKNVMRDENPKDQKWGRFAPVMSGTDGDGNVFYSPDPAWIDEKMLEHAKSRASEVANPLRLAIYYDLLFEHSKEKDKISYALAAIENYKKAADIYYLHEDRMFECQDSLSRILEISLKIGSDKEKTQAIRMIASQIDKMLQDGKYRFSLELLKLLVSYHKHLNQTQIDSIFKAAEDCSSYFEHLEQPNRFLQRPFIEICADLSHKLKKTEEEIKYKKQIADSYMKEAEERAAEGGFIRAHLLEQAYAILEQAKALDSDKQKLLKEIEEAYVDSEKDMKPIVTEVKIPQKQIDDFVKAFITNDIAESLTRIGMSKSLVPTLDDAQKMTEKEAKQFPLQHLISRKIIQDGKKINTIAGGLEVNEDQTIATLGRNIYFGVISLGFLFEALKSKGVNGKAIGEYLKDKDFFQYDNFGAIQQGLEVLDQENYFSAMNTIVPQIEELLRKVLRRLGKPSSKVDRGNQRALYINEILESMRPDIGEDSFWYLYLILHDKKGPAIRNNLSHGLYKIAPSNKQDSYLVLHILLILANYSVQEKKQK